MPGSGPGDLLLGGVNMSDSIRSVLRDALAVPTARSLDTDRDAEACAATWMRHFGFVDAADSYTALWNLCCTPAFLVKTSGTHADVVALFRYRACDPYGVCPDGVDEPREPASYDQLSWMPHPPALDGLEGTMRERMASAPRRPATQAARAIG